MNDKMSNPSSSTAVLPTTTLTSPAVPISTQLTTVSSAASPLTTSTGVGVVSCASIATQPSILPIQQTIAHPSVPPSPIPQMQMIQQPLQSPTYLPHIYSPQQQLLMPGNIAMSPSIQVIAAGKTCVPNQLATQMLAGKQMLQGQSNYMPSTTNQTLVIGQLGVLPSQASMIPAHAKQVADSQKVRPYAHTAVTVAGTQVLNSSQFKQLTSQATLVSTPQLITSQAPAAMIASQSQIINGLQAISTSLPPGLTWATHGGLQSHAAVITAPNPIFFRSSQQQDMYIQSQPPTPAQIQPQPGLASVLQHQHQQQQQQQQQHPSKPKQATFQTLELTPAIHAKVQTTCVGTKTLSSILPSPAPAPIRPASSVATQTNAMTHGTHFGARPQLKQRSKAHMNRASPAPGAVHLQHKADAANQTKIILNSQHSSPIQTKIQADGKMIHPLMANQSQNCSPVVTADASTNVNVVSIKPTVNTTEEPMDTAEVPPSTVVTLVKDNSQILPNKTVPNVNQSLQPIAEVVPTEEMRTVLTPTPAVTSVVPQGGPPPKMRTVAGMTENACKEQPASSSLPIHLNGGRVNPTLVPPSPQENGVPPPHNNVISVESAKEKQQPQKAIVKPHVLTHVIEGFIIQEAPDPFPVNRSSLMSEFADLKSTPPVDKETPQEVLPASGVEAMSVTPSLVPETPNSQEIQTEVWSGRGESGKYPKQKKKHSIKMKKSLRKIQSGRLSYNAEDWNVVESPNKEEETNSSNSGAESSLSPITPPSSQKDLMELDIVDAEARKSPQKWSVQDVFEFIKSLPGCADYADEFRLQEIDGQALLLLKEDHLMTAMNMKLGPALKICARINSLKDELQRQ